MFEYAIIGGGIVGLATAYQLLLRHPGTKLVLFEKEKLWAAHQTGHNSGVIHSGLYYKPGSMKARMAGEGNRSMIAFCREQGIPFDVCGKLVVATDDAEVALLDNLEARGRENGLQLSRLTGREAQRVEPHVSARAALHLATTGITDYRLVCDRLAELVREMGGELRLGEEVATIESKADRVVLRSKRSEAEARFLIACAGLQSDRVARKERLDPRARIVPFRGEYYELRPERRELVRGLIYPVPNPAFPFLGVHLTRMIDGSIHAGPNAVLAFAREGYRKTDINLADLASALSFPGFWRMAWRNLGEGWGEMRRSWSRELFVRSLRKLVPGINEQDVTPAGGGVRAQALLPSGELVDDFLFVHGTRSLHVCNAPSPAATASLEIGRAIVNEVGKRR